MSRLNRLPPAPAGSRSLSAGATRPLSAISSISKNPGAIQHQRRIVPSGPPDVDESPAPSTGSSSLISPDILDREKLYDVSE